MPVKSAKQYRFMQLIAHRKRGGKASRTNSKGPSPAVARRFIEATPKRTRRKYAKRKRSP